MVPHENHRPQALTAPGGTGVPPTPPEGTAPFNPTVNALLDHLLVIEDRFGQIEDALLATAADFLAVKALVEELLP